ncbi:MAG: hypothetical protein HW421_2722 [Ignavibacteria bacterium]|nr:hypothetical protein [Ignavibacteria bacterium]
MKIYILISIILIHLVSCKESSQPADNTLTECMPLKTGNYWVYNVIDKGVSKPDETDKVEGSSQMKIDSSNTATVYTIITYINNDSVNTWYMFKSADTLSISANMFFEPLKSVIDLTKIIWLKFPICSENTFQTESSYLEPFTIVIDGTPVNGKFNHVYQLSYKFASSSQKSVNGKNYSFNRYNCTVNYFEEIAEPEEIVFTNGSRKRNQFTFPLIIEFSKGAGFLLIQDQIKTRTIKEISIK